MSPLPAPEPTVLKRIVRRLAFAFLPLAAVPAAAPAQALDYAQLDRSPSATTVVLVKALGAARAAAPAPLLAATYARWSTGEAGAVGITWRTPLADGTHRWIAGAGLGANTFRSREAGTDGDESAASVRAQSEWSGPAPRGAYYALVQGSSFRSSWLALAQYAPAALPMAAEWTRYHERGYQSTSLGVRIAPGSPRWFLRLGATRAQGDTHPYVGVAYNGF